jgi:hypothetical protein
MSQLDPVQAAWARWIWSDQYFNRDTIEPTHRAFHAGWNAAVEQLLLAQPDRLAHPDEKKP